MKMFVEPEHSLNGRPSAVATCSSTRTLVVPTAMTLLALLTARAAASGRKKMLRMHLMVFYPVRLDGTECSYPHVQG